jgi:hypothetical protein
VGLGPAATYKNIVFQANVAKDQLEIFYYIPIPVLKGLLGHRIFLTTKKHLSGLNSFLMRSNYDNF